MKLSTILLISIVLVSLLNAGWEQNYRLGGYLYPVAAYEASDGGFLYLVQHVDDRYAHASIMLFRVDYTGDLEDVVSLGVDNHVAGDMFPVGDGSFQVFGTYTESLLIYNVDQYGALNWAQKYVVPVDNGVAAVAKKTDGNYIVVARDVDYSTVTERLVIFEVDSLGELLWVNPTEVGGWPAMVAYQAVEDTSGGFVTDGLGYLGDNDTLTYFLFRFDPNGSIIDTLDTCVLYFETDGRFVYLLCGSHDSNLLTWGGIFEGGGYIWYLREVDLTGATVREVPLPDEGYLRPFYGIPLEDGYIVVGIASADGEERTDVDLFMMKVDRELNAQWLRKYGDPGMNEFSVHVSPTSDGGFITFSYLEDPYYATYGLFAVKTDSLGYTPVVEAPILKPASFSLEVYPNPFNSSVTIRIQACQPKPWRRMGVKESSLPTEALAKVGNQGVEIFDINGRLVDSWVGGQVGTFDRSGSPDPRVTQSPDNQINGISSYIWSPDASVGSGVYLVRATVGDKVLTKRVVYLK